MTLKGSCVMRETMISCKMAPGRIAMAPDLGSNFNKQARSSTRYEMNNENAMK